MPSPTRARDPWKVRLPRPSMNGILYPLDVVYRRAGILPPGARSIRAEDVPMPYRRLLVHQDDMTMTLERFVGGRVLLRTLSTFARKPWYYRRVLLSDAESGRPVEMG